MISKPLITVAALAAALESDRPPVLLDVRWNLMGPAGLGEYEAGHLPGAQWIDLDHELSGPKRADGAGGRHPLPSLAVLTRAVRRVGVRTDRPVVAYDAATGLSAARAWWLLTDAGHPEVAVLDGGYAAWLAAGQPGQQGPAPSVEAGDFVPEPGRRPRMDGHELAELITADDHRPVLDVRAGERYAASTDPMDPVAGHVPGALSVPSMSNLVSDDHGVHFAAAAVIRTRYADYPDPVLYCGSGITAAHSLLALESAGLTGTIYPGSWSDWITDPARPVATGDEPG